MTDKQISAFIAAETNDLVERYSYAHGVKKGHLVEQALLHHLRALRELPSEVLVPPRMTLDEESFEKVARLVEKPRRPTKAMRELMRGNKAK